MPGPASPRVIGRSAGVAIRTWVGASRRRSLRTNFGRTTCTMTDDAGRRSSASLTSAPMRSKAARPSSCTSCGISSTTTRGRWAGKGLRPCGVRVWLRTGWGAGGALGAASPSSVAGQQIERQLPVVGREPFGLLPEEPALELLVRFEQLLVERPVVLPVGRGLRERRFQGGEAGVQRLDRRVGRLRSHAHACRA